MSYMLVDVKKKHNLMFKVLKSIYISIYGCIYEHIHIDIWFKIITVSCVFMSYCGVFSSLVVGLTKYINICSPS